MGIEPTTFGLKVRRMASPLVSSGCVLRGSITISGPARSRSCASVGVRFSPGVCRSVWTFDAIRATSAVDQRPQQGHAPPVGPVIRLGENLFRSSAFSDSFASLYSVRPSKNSLRSTLLSCRYPAITCETRLRAIGPPFPALELSTYTTAG